jgi:hypothetical protein
MIVENEQVEQEYLTDDELSLLWEIRNKEVSFIR